MALRLAIIEDNADLLDELLAWLGYRGFEVWGTRSAEAFWRQLHSHPVDIVLVDIGLPGEDGFSVLNYLHELGHYGLVVVSARGQQQDKLQAGFVNGMVASHLLCHSGTINRHSLNGALLS